MKSLIKRIIESKRARLIAGLCGLTFATGCADMDPNAAQGMSLLGTGMQLSPYTSLAGKAVGGVMQVGGQNSLTRRNALDGRSQVNVYTAQQGNGLSPVFIPGPVMQPEFFAFRWVDLNKDGALFSNGQACGEEMYDLRKKVFNPDTEDFGVCLIAPAPFGGIFQVRIFNSRGDIVCEKAGSCDVAAHILYLRTQSSDPAYGEPLGTFKSSPDGDYRIVITTWKEQQTFFQDITLKRDDKKDETN